MLASTDFFDLSEFEHAAVFEGTRYVWDVLTGIRSYIEQTMLGRGYERRIVIMGSVMSGAYIEGSDIFIGEGTIVEPGAMIKGPALIGAGVEIRQGAYIRGNVIVGDGAVVGHASEVKNSILLNGAKAAHFAYVGDSVLGNGVNLGAGTKLANLKMVETNVEVVVGGKRYDTGLQKFGAIIGDQSETGCNSVTMPGTLLSKRCLIYPNVTAGGYFEADSVVRPADRP
ncbi:MAG: glucose-1-phosphate thymidylyltransferase, partial [Dehalococcoidia bacterium]|nr:glucose-1-phosphate thymidylyltransferase [Dehalococcoidia bacterium]